jgi:hypothetical protein
MFHNLRTSQFRKAFIYTACLGLMITVASADQTAPETFTFNGSDATQFTLPAFDPSLGTLESVDLTFSLVSCGIVQAYNTSGVPLAFTNASVRLFGSVSGPGGVNLGSSFNATVASGVVQPKGLNWFYTALSDNSVSQHIDGDSLSLWENQPDDTVSFDYTHKTATYGGTSQGNGIRWGGKISGNGEVTVEYTYLSTGNLATPEPAGRYLSFIVAGAMLIMLLGRRKALVD